MGQSLTYADRLQFFEVFGEIEIDLNGFGRTEVLIIAVHISLELAAIANNLLAT